MTHTDALSAFSSLAHFVPLCTESTDDEQTVWPHICVLHLTSLGLPGCNGGGVLWWSGGCTVPLPVLHSGSLCLHCHAVCHSQGMETNCLQVSTFSGLSACLSALVFSFCTILYVHPGVPSKPAHTKEYCNLKFCFHQASFTPYPRNAIS